VALDARAFQPVAYVVNKRH